MAVFVSKNESSDRLLVVAPSLILASATQDYEQGHVGEGSLTPSDPLRSLQVALADDHRIRTTQTVECAKDGDGIFDDDCLSLPKQAGMVARYTISLTQVSTDVSDGVVAIYGEIPYIMDFDNTSVTTPDGSFPEILSITPLNFGNATDEVWGWDFSSSPVTFQLGEVKTFSYNVDIPNFTDRYCNDVFLDMDGSAPNEQAGKQDANVAVGLGPPAGCDGAGTSVEKFAIIFMATRGVNTVFTYIINVENLANNTSLPDDLIDTLPEGGTSPFRLCTSVLPPGDFPALSCEDPMYKLVEDPFDPSSGDFASTADYTAMPVAAAITTADTREVLTWDITGLNPAAAGGMILLSCASRRKPIWMLRAPTIMRFL